MMSLGFEAITSSETSTDSIVGSTDLKDSSVEDSYQALAKHLKPALVYKEEKL